MTDFASPKNFAAIGVAGFVAPRHLRAIFETGNKLVAAVDPHDSVGILDQYSHDVKFFTEIERFDRHLEKLRNTKAAVDYISVMSPNYLHDAHCRLAMRLDADVICEKPLVINPWNLDQLASIEQRTSHKIYTILQLRLHPDLLRLKQTIDQNKDYEVKLSYVTARGPWYHTSWKGSDEKSGGIAVNIGIHFFDLLIWLFGNPLAVEVEHSDTDRMMGCVNFINTTAHWFLSTDQNDLPRQSDSTTWRSITIDKKDIEFSTGFTNLHTRAYEEILAGRGFGIQDARPAIELVHKIRSCANDSK